MLQLGMVIVIAWWARSV